MVNKTKKAGIKKVQETSESGTSPAFPYSNKPNSLRKFLEMIPEKPKPSKINVATLKAWGLKDSNDTSIIRVLKALGLVSTTNEPTERYTEFMSPDKGPAVLASGIRSVWAPLFEHSHHPHKEDDSTLRRYFNIHSGGSEKTIAYQIQTFKAACDHADFGAPTPQKITELQTGSGGSASAVTAQGASTSIHIDLHIHLPENKTRRDYENIFEDISRYIFGREPGEKRDD